MQTYEIIVSGRAVRANSADTTLVRTSVGIDKIHVLFDNEEWRSFPVRVTFANGTTLVSTSVTLTALDSTEWAAEAECTIPWEVIQTLGGIRITFQGTDSSGKHIITEASGTPLTVVEAGDVVDGSEPQPDPTIDEWHQAYADAMAAASDAASAAEQVAEILHSTDAQTLEELIAALGSAIRYKGSVATYADLPDDAEPGDMYNVAAAYGDYPAGTNWAWTVDETWDPLGGEIDLSIFATKDSPALTGTPTAPTAASGTDTTQLATTAFVQQEIDDNAYELPVATESTLGGVKQGQGLHVEDGSLSLGPLVGEGNPTHGCALYAVSGEGWSEQDGTPTPESPVPIEVCRGRNLLVPNTAVATMGAESIIFNGAVADSTPFNAITLEAGTYVAKATLLSKPSTDRTLRLYNGSTQLFNFDGLNSRAVGYTAQNVFTVSERTTVTSKLWGGATNDFSVQFQLELGTTPTPYVPYGHVGLEVQGKNLLPNTATSQTINGVTFTINPDGSITCNGTATAAVSLTIAGVIVGSAGTYTLSGTPSGGGSSTYNIRYFRNSSPTFSVYDYGSGGSVTLSDEQAQASGGVRIAIASGYTCNNLIFHPQLEAGTEATPYVPYAPHTTTPIPLPSKGWAGGLPDGTADALAVDSAGRYVWECPTDEVVFDGSSDEDWYIYAGRFRINSPVTGMPSVPAVSQLLASHFVVFAWSTSNQPDKTMMVSSAKPVFRYDNLEQTVAAWASWLSANPITVLYTLATPTTEHGYIDLPRIIDGCTVSCPELDELGVSWFVAGAKELVEHAENWHRREDMASRLAALEATVAELATS